MAAPAQVHPHLGCPSYAPATDFIALMTSGSAPSSVVVALDQSGRYGDVLEVLRAAHVMGTRVGFVDTFRGAEAATRHANRIATWTPVRRPGITFWDSDSQLDTGLRSTTGLDLIRQDERAPIRFLRDSRRTIGAVSHGNGVDAELGDALLCGLLTAPHGLTMENYFPCGQGGRCVRGRLVDGEYVHPERHAVDLWSGDVVVWGSCHGALFPDSALDPRGGLLGGLLERKSGAPQVITTVRAGAVDVIEVLAACARVEAGESLGDVVHQLNEAYLSTAPRDAPPIWILFGDPDARVVDDLAVPIVSNGPVPREGLSIVRPEPANRTRPPIVLFDLGDTTVEPPWVRPLHGGRDGLILSDARCAAVSVDRFDEMSVLREVSEGLRTLAREVDSVSQLLFSHVLFQLAAASPAGGGRYEYGPTAAAAIQNASQRLTNLRVVGQAGLASRLSGGTGRFTERLRVERERWTDLNVEVFALLRQLVLTLGSVPQHLYTGARVDGSEFHACPYCGDQAERTLFHPIDNGSTRAVVRCGKCTVISDTDTRYGPALITGPDVVGVGEIATFGVKLDRIPELGFECCTAQLILQPVPTLVPEETESSTMIANNALPDPSSGDGGWCHSLEWRAPPHADPGRYFMVLILVVDGSVAIGRRPVLLR